MEVRVPEIERRKNHISKVDPDHPLLTIVKKCLNDVDVERPSAHQLCRFMEILKEEARYNESICSLQSSQSKIEVHLIPAPASGVKKEEKKEVALVGLVPGGSGGKFRELQGQLLQSLRIGEPVRALERSPVSTPVVTERNSPVDTGRSPFSTPPFSTGSCTPNISTEMENLKGKLEHAEQVLQEKDKMVAERERQLQHMSLQCQEVTSKYMNRIQELEQLPIQTIRNSTLQLRSDAGTKASTIRSGVLMLHNWRECKRSPCPMARATDNAAVGCRSVYFRLSGCRQVYAYNTTNRSWTQLPDCPFEYCSLTCISNLVTTVGGFRNGCTDQLYSLTGEGSGRRWTREFPSMPTKRSHTAALCNQVVLIVAGGRTEGQSVLRTVEVMDVDTYQWSMAADLPVPLHLALATICCDQLYVSGGRDENRHPSRCVFTCSLSSLLQTCSSMTVEDQLDSPSRTQQRHDHPGLWGRIADLPVTESTCVTVGGQLLAIGGMDSDNKPTTTILVHNQNANAWEIVGEMSTARSWCFAAVLPEGKLMVVGGCTRSGIFYKSLAVTDKVELASVE